MSQRVVAATFTTGSYGGWVATGGPERSKAQAESRRAEERQIVEEKARDEEAARQREAETKLKESEEKLNEAEALLGAGQLAQARQAAEQAKELSLSSPRLAGIMQRLDEAAHHEALATLPARHTAIANKAHEGLWDEAATLCEAARAIDPSHTQVKATCGEVDAELRKLKIDRWVGEANRVASEQCDTPAAVGAAWADLKEVQTNDVAYKEAKKASVRLEKCRKSMERTLSAALRTTMVKQRVDWAERYEAQQLDSGMDVRVTLQGKHKDTAKILWVLLGRALVHQITKDGTFLAGLQTYGFKRVTFSDGYFESWSFDLTPESEEDGGKIALHGVGLSNPIKM